MRIEETLGNKDWLNQNETALRNLFPETWTHISNVNNLGILYHLKLMGVDMPNAELTVLLKFFLETGVIIQQDQQIKRGHQHIEFMKVFKMETDTPMKKTRKKKKSSSAASNLLSGPSALVLLFWWISGFVVAKGFWSTLLCILPFWSMYLVAERLLQMWGVI